MQTLLRKEIGKLFRCGGKRGWRMQLIFVGRLMKWISSPANPKQAFRCEVIRGEILVTDRPALGHARVHGRQMVFARREIGGKEPLQRHAIKRAGAARPAANKRDKAPRPSL